MNKRQDWDGTERRRTWGAGFNMSNECPIDPECFFRTKQQVEINTHRLDIVESQVKQIIEAKLVAEGAVKGSRATLAAAGALVIISVAIVISLFIAVINGKLSLSEFLKIVF
jgi:hypothetical protein